MISSLRLTRFKSHELTQLSFSKGNQSFNRPNGRGQEFCYGRDLLRVVRHFPRIEKPQKITLDEVITSRPVKQSDAKVQLILRTAAGYF